MNPLPDWPAAMRRPRAAAYCDLSEASFTREVAAGRLPAPFTVGGTEHWNKQQLDRALLILAGEVIDGGDTILINGRKVA